MSDPVTEDYDDEEEVDRQVTLKCVKEMANSVENDIIFASSDRDTDVFVINKNKCRIRLRGIPQDVAKKLFKETKFDMNPAVYLSEKYIIYFQEYPSFLIRCSVFPFFVQIGIKFKDTSFTPDIEDDIEPIVLQLCRQWSKKPADGWFYIKDGSPL